MKYTNHTVDLCVVGGGLAGTCAAIAAARHGLKVVLMQDRPVLGGNASGEVRMWVCGAHGDNNREGGILEEIELENFYRNTGLNYSVWDSVVYEKAYLQEGLTLLLNTTCQTVQMDGSRIVSVTGWQMTSETYHTVQAKFFADCSGDSILAPLTGAEFRLGRESREEFGEPIAPPKADNKTMGNSCLFQIRETDRPQPFIPPEWAYSFPTDEDIPLREHDLGTNYWWIELGGDRDSIHDADELRHELLRIALGVWDHVKNHGDHGADNWVIDWIGFLPAKRESRRYVGDVIINQHDVEAGGKFEDIVAYGGWTMDDHFPAGFAHRGSYPTIHHPAPSPWGIPWRALYSKNIDNLAFAGRNISVTHTALSSSRVMGTCALLGQAVGTGVALAVKDGTDLRRCFKDNWAGSHFHWAPDGSHRMLVTAIWDGEKRQAWQRADWSPVEFTVGEEEKVRLIGKGGILDKDWHCLYSPDCRFMSGETYWNRNFERPWVLVRLADGMTMPMGSFFVPEKYRGGYWRCDLHARYRPDGRQIAFTSVHEGSRQVYVRDIEPCSEAK
jgi:hypothetical protein